MLAAVLLVVGGLAWGLTSSFATSASPSPASGKVVLRLGWMTEPDNLNPFIGYADDTYEIWALNYSYLFGSGNYNQPTLDLASRVPDGTERRHLAGRQGVDDPPAAQREVAGRHTTDGRRRGLHLQLHHQERHDQPHQLHAGHQVGESPRSDDGAGHLHRRPRPTSRRPRPACRSCPSTSGRTSRPSAASTALRQQAADRRQRPLPDRGLRQGQLRQDGAQPLLVRPEAGHRPDLLRAVPERRHDDQRPQGRARIDGAWTSSPKPRSSSSSRRRASRRPRSTTTLGLPRVQLLRQAELAGQPGAARLALPQRLELRHRPAAALRRSPTTASPPRARPSSRRTASPTPTTTGSRRPTSSTPSTWPRPASCSTAAGYPLKNGVRLEQAGQADHAAALRPRPS